MADIHKYTSKEVLNKVLLDSSGDAVNAFSHTTSEALNAALDDTNSRLNVSLEGGTIGGDVTISGDLTVSGGGTLTYDETVTGDLFIDKNFTGTTTATTRGLFVDFDATGITASGQTATNIGLDLDMNSDDPTMVGTVNNTGLDLDVVGGTSGTTKNIGIDVNVSGADTNYAALFNGGNVGIGTVAPARPLEVRTDQNGATIVQVTNDTAGTAAQAQLRVLSNSSHGVITVCDDGFTSSGMYLADAFSVFAPDSCSGGMILGTEGDHNVSIYQNSSIKMKLDANSRISLSNNDSGGTGGEDSTSGNTILGYLSGAAIASGGLNNTTIGHKAGNAISTADNNVFIGALAGSTHLTGGRNTAIGSQAMFNTDEDSDSNSSISNVFIGAQAGGGTWAGETSNHNIGIGDLALGGALAGGDGTVAIGSSALKALTSGARNMAIGYTAGGLITDGTDNTLIGYQSGNQGTYGIVGGDYNTGVGAYSMGASAGAAITGSSNTAIGYNAMLEAQGAVADNTAVGSGALQNITTATKNIAIGTLALSTNTGGGDNIAIGYHAAKLGEDNTGFQNNIAIGNYALDGSTGESLSECVAIGYAAMSGAVTAAADGSTAVGYTALNALTSGQKNVAVGYQAGLETTIGDSNIAIGYQALVGDGAFQNDNNIAIGSANPDGTLGAMGGQWETAASTNNIAIGTGSMDGAMNNSHRNTCIGTNSGTAITTGDDNVLIGNGSGTFLSAASFITGIGSGTLSAGGVSALALGATAVGYKALGDLSGGQGNTAVGYFALENCSTGDFNTAIGFEALTTEDIGFGTTAVGYRAAYLQNSDDADEVPANTAIGAKALYTNVDGQFNTAVGYESLYTFEADTDNHGENTAVGYQSGYYVSTGTGNTYIGKKAGFGNSGSNLAGDNNTALGYQAGFNLRGVAHSNTLVGATAGDAIEAGIQNTILGFGSETGHADSVNQTVIGCGVTSTDTDNSVTLGNADVTAVYMAQDKGAKVYCAEIEMGTVSAGSEGWSIPADMISRSYHAGTGSQAHMIFHNGNGDVGSIDSSGTATAYNTSSDYRLKENEVTLSDGITRLKNLKPYRFNFKSDKDKTLDGFFAHEVAEVVPEAITGEKDAVDDDGNMIRQGIDHSKLVPLLVKAVQELSAKVKALEAK